MIHKTIETPEAGTVHHIEVTCADLDSEVSVRYTNKCSEGCAEGMRMFFTPKLLGSTIHAQVCAGRWEFVNKLSKEWWARKAASILGWDEEKIREQTDPVWAAKRLAGKVHSANNSSSRSSKSYRGPKCAVCEKPVSRGIDICNACQTSEPQISVTDEEFEDIFKGLED